MNFFLLLLSLSGAAWSAPPAAQFAALARLLVGVGCTASNSACPNALRTQLANEARAAENSGVNSTACETAGQLNAFFGCGQNETVIDYLSLQNLNLSGSLIAADLARLSGLTYLRVEKNQRLGGSLPTTIGNLTRLTALYLQENNFTGVLPVQLGRLSALKDIRVQGNEFQGPVPPLPASLPNSSACFLQVFAENRSSELGNCFNLTTCPSKCRCDPDGCLLTTTTTTRTTIATTTTTTSGPASTQSSDNGSLTVDSNSTLSGSTTAGNGTVSSSSTSVAADPQSPSAPSLSSSSDEDSLANGAGNVFEENMYAFIGAGAALLLICLIIVVVCVVRSRRKRDVTTIRTVPVEYGQQQTTTPPTPYLRQQEENYGAVVQPSVYETVGGAVNNAAMYGDQGGQSTMQTLESPRPDQYQALPSHASESARSMPQSPSPSMPSSPRPLLQRNDSGVNF